MTGYVETATAVAGEDSAAGRILPAWRGLLESRWRQRLGLVTRLSLAYHDAAERSGGDGTVAGDRARTRRLLRLMQETVAARRALCDTEEALARLAAGHFGRCEQCAADIPAAWLEREPEARYCERCCRLVPTADVASRSAPFGIKMRNT